MQDTNIPSNGQLHQNPNDPKEGRRCFSSCLLKAVLHMWAKHPPEISTSTRLSFLCSHSFFFCNLIADGLKCSFRKQARKLYIDGQERGPVISRFSNLLITPPLGPIILFGVYYHLTNTETLLVRGPFISKPIDRRRETTVFSKKGNPKTEKLLFLFGMAQT